MAGRVSSTWGPLFLLPEMVLLLYYLLHFICRKFRRINIWFRKFYIWCLHLLNINGETSYILFPWILKNYICCLQTLQSARKREILNLCEFTATCQLSLTVWFLSRDAYAYDMHRTTVDQSVVLGPVDTICREIEIVYKSEGPFRVWLENSNPKIN